MNSNSYLEENATWKKMLFYLNVVIYTKRNLSSDLKEENKEKCLCVCQCQRI